MRLTKGDAVNPHPEKKSVIIIGAGIAGMATGCYLQMNGFNTRIYEKHVLPGGCCTAWSRKGYIFDYCIDWLIGSGSGNDANKVWRELGALDGKKIRHFDLFNRVVDEKGTEVNFYNDPKRLQNHLLLISPEDKKLITQFCKDLERFLRVDIFQPLKPNRLMSMREKVGELKKALPFMGLFMRTGATQMRAFSARFKSDVLKRSLNYIFFQDPESFPILPFLYNMACAHKNNAGFPEGGSLGLSRSVEQRYLSLGGAIHYGRAIKKILVENHQAIGIELKMGPPEHADYIISACDGYTTIYELLEGKYVNQTIDKLYKDVLNRPGILFPSVISIFVGYKGEVGQKEPHSTTYLLLAKDAEKLPGCAQNCLVLQHRSRYADGFAKPDHSVIHCTYFSDFDFWQSLRLTDKPLYREKKRDIAAFICQFLEKLYPGINDRIEIVEVATPATTKRYTGNLKGSIFGFKAFSDAEDLAQILVNKYRMQLPNLARFYMTGQWVLGGGLPRSAMSGRYVAQFLCDEVKKTFVVAESNSMNVWSNSQLGKLPELDFEPVLERQL
jgi:phytoene dehydrogenase-like protein